jgi:hypothetical protein
MKRNFTAWVFSLVTLLSFGQVSYTPPTPQPIPCLLHSHYNPPPQPGNIVSSYNCIVVDGTIHHHGIAAGLTSKELTAGEYINIRTDDKLVDVITSSQSTVTFKIDKSAIEAAWFYPQANPGTVGKWEKLELGFVLPQDVTDKINNYLSNNQGQKLNPYDPDQVDLRVVFTAPNGQQRTQFGFYYVEKERDFANQTWMDINQDYNWRVRFAPYMLGNWTVSVQLYINNQLHSGLNSAINFNCVPSGNKGPLEVVPNSRKMRYRKTGQSFFCNWT